MRGQPPIAIPEDSRRKAIQSLRQYFAKELDLEIGDLKASLVLDYLLTEIGPAVYNTAIADARAFVEERLAALAAPSHRDEVPYGPAATRRKPSPKPREHLWPCWRMQTMRCRSRRCWRGTRVRARGCT